MKRLLIFFLAIVGFPLAVAANDQPLSEAEQVAVQRALDRGLALHRYDEAAWHTTDALREDIEDLGSSRIGGWVVTPIDGDLLTTYWRRDGESFRGVYSAVWTGQEVRERTILSASDSALNKEQLDLIGAIQAIRREDAMRCGDKPFNIVALPSEDSGGPIAVYALTPQTSFAAIPFGGHHRFEVKGGQIAAKRSFTNSCLTIPLENLADGGGPTEALYVTHVLDPVPTELHVFSVFAAKVPIMVRTTENDAVWAVEISGGQPRIRKVK